MLAWLLDDVRGARDHREGLWHPRLRLDVVLLGVRSATLVDNSLVWIEGASDDWHALYTTRVLLWISGCSVVWG